MGRNKIDKQKRKIENMKKNNSKSQIHRSGNISNVHFELYIHSCWLTGDKPP